MFGEVSRGNLPYALYSSSTTLQVQGVEYRPVFLCADERKLIEEPIKGEDGSNLSKKGGVGKMEVT